jgi:hypothetical protein
MNFTREWLVDCAWGIGKISDKKLRLQVKLEPNSGSSLHGWLAGCDLLATIEL